MRNSLTSADGSSFSRCLLLGGLVLVVVTSASSCKPQQASQRTPKTPAQAQVSDADSLAPSVPAPPASVTELGREATIARADKFAERRDYGAAAAELRKLLLGDPGDVEVLFRLAGVQANSGDLASAVDLLDEIPADHPEAGLAALGQSADWCVQLERYGDAEQRYRKVLAQAPQAVPALRQLAYLLNRQGRRHEAADYIRQLCRLGDVRQDELHSLIALSDAMYDSPDAKEPTAISTPYWPIGASGEARKRFNEGDFQQALGLLHPSLVDGTAPPAVVALYGRCAAEAQDDEKFAWWLTRTNEQLTEQADYWAAVGTVALGQRKFEQATRALAEALLRDPTDLASMARMRQALGTLGDDVAAQRWFDRWTEVHDVIDVNNRVAATQPPDPQAIAQLASMLSKLDRPLEAVLWKSIQAHYQGSPRSELLKLNAERERLVASGTAFPQQASRLCGLDLNDYPLPVLETPPVAATESIDFGSGERRPTPARFENVGTRIGLRHTFYVESQPISQHFAIYQTLGGGVAVLDYDLDGNSDLYLAQGGADPPSFRGTMTNQLFRHLGGMLTDTTERAAAVEFQYSTGITAGDWNQDGFPDLAIANIGTSVLLINNGDGTFSRRHVNPRAKTTQLSTSLAIADINGDRMPDLFQVCYVDDPKMVVKPPLDEDGQVLHTVSPSNFVPCPDRLIENDGTGDFSSEVLHPRNEARAGLGVVITDFDGQGGNDVFVGNDTFPNRLLVREPNGTKLTDVAPLLGCAYGFSGGATGAMGIATGDFDQNGSLDIHVANYENENANLFLRKHDAFQDRNIQYQLGADTRNLVGFGTQAIDYDNDGSLDLVVTNGHLDDAKSIRGTYQQPPQLFCNLGDRFQLADVSGMSKYWQSDHVGRGLATLDFNRDGKLDVVITHIEQATALLINRTPSAHHWLQLKLVGTACERDSVGARIQLICGQRKFNGWVIAGDGYLSHNENVVCFGLGQADQIDELVIDWPTGDQQVFHDVPADHRLLIVQNEDQPHVFLPPPQSPAD